MRASRSDTCAASQAFECMHNTLSHRVKTYCTSGSTMMPCLFSCVSTLVCFSFPEYPLSTMYLFCCAAEPEAVEQPPAVGPSDELLPIHAAQKAATEQPVPIWKGLSPGFQLLMNVFRHRSKGDLPWAVPSGSSSAGRQWCYTSSGTNSCIFEWRVAVAAHDRLLSDTSSAPRHN